MSYLLFIASDVKFPKTRFEFKDIIPSIKEGDMFYSHSISFESELSNEEKDVIGSLFKGKMVYAVRSDFSPCYNPISYNQISKEFQINSFNFLLWFKNFILTKCYEGANLAVLGLNIGQRTAPQKIKVLNDNPTEWMLSLDQEFDFGVGVVHTLSGNCDVSMNDTVSFIQKELDDTGREKRYYLILSEEADIETIGFSQNITEEDQKTLGAFLSFFKVYVADQLPDSRKLKTFIVDALEKGILVELVKLYPGCFVNLFDAKTELIKATNAADLYPAEDNMLFGILYQFL